MAGTVHVQVVIPSKTGIAKDACVNTFTFDCGSNSPDSAVVAAIDPMLDDFYNTAAGVDPICQYLSRDRDRSADACTRKYYDITGHLNGSAAGPPFLESSWTLGATSIGTFSLPDECACALSFHGSDLTIPEFAPGARPRSRHRGRLFIGPLTASNVVDPDSNDVPFLSNEIQNDIIEAASALMVASSTAGLSGVPWRVWSRRNAATYTVVGGWVDNTFDTQRRRGIPATSRLTMGAPV